MEFLQSTWINLRINEVTVVLCNETKGFEIIRVNEMNSYIINCNQLAPS